MSVVILNERARRFEAEAESPWLSLKCMFNGSARYRVGRREYAVGHGQCLLLNDRTPYAIMINSAEIVESFVVFFQPEWVADALYAHLENDKILLDEPFGGGRQEFSFQETLHPLDGGIELAHRKLRRWHRSDPGESSLRDEIADELLSECVRREAAIIRESARLGATRKATRVELHRRLRIARDFLLSNHSSRISLRQVARASCLSPFHLSRQFKAVYGVAPMSFLHGIRMRRAVDLLRDGKSVLEVCLEVGFESPTTFSARIKRYTGLNPRALKECAKSKIEEDQRPANRQYRGRQPDIS